MMRITFRFQRRLMGHKMMSLRVSVLRELSDPRLAVLVIAWRRVLAMTIAQASMRGGHQADDAIYLLAVFLKTLPHDKSVDAMLRKLIYNSYMGLVEYAERKRYLA